MRTALTAALSLVIAGTIATAFEVSETDAKITVTKGEKTVLVYHKDELPPPEGQDPLFRRSGFIHPLCAPSGQPVTGIHPDDHIHHVGLWGAWVNTVYGDEKPDFWNLKKGTGRVRYTSTVVAKVNDGGHPLIQVVQDYVAKDNKRVLSEYLTIAIKEIEGAYAIDYTSTQVNTSKITLKLPANRYGGPIAYRGPAHWNNSNSTVLTSEGRSREDGHATRARWCAFSGSVKEGQAGLAILCHPSNHDAPQRVRIWPSKTHDGAVFFNYVPVQEHAWSIDPGKQFTMRYRLLVHDGETNAESVESTWKKFAGE